MTVPALLRSFQQVLDAEPVGLELPRLAHRLAKRIDPVVSGRTVLPVSLLTVEHYQAHQDRVGRARYHLQAFGLDLLPVTSRAGQDVVLYVHRPHARDEPQDVAALVGAAS